MSRLKKEYDKIKLSNDLDCKLWPINDSLQTWESIIKGPPDTPYSGVSFKLLIEVGERYPMSAPSISFKTKIFHPNVHFKTGEICLDILKKEWSPIWNLESAVRAVITLLAYPEAGSPLNCDAGNLIRAGDMVGFNSLARMYTIDEAMEETEL